MNNDRIAVLGFGKTGQALLEFLLTHEPQAALFLFNDSEIADKERQKIFEQRGVRFLIGVDKFSELGVCKLVIMSPGFDGKNPRFVALRLQGVKVISEIEYAFGHIQAKIIAVSGSNGKSTTVSLIHHLLLQAGRKSILAGNIGTPFIAQAGHITNESLVVLELSSFQLEEIIHFRADVAVLLNITPDHLDRYPSMDAYAAAKFNLFKNQRPEDCMVLNADDPLLRDEKRLGPGKSLRFSSTHVLHDGAALENHDIIFNFGAVKERISLRRNPLRGIHNLENIMAAALACRAVGLTTPEIESGLASFQGLPHRMEAVGKVGRVEFINDSKATNVDAALKSIASIDGNLVVILGGKDKGSDFSVLEKTLRARTQKILMLGQAAPLIAAQLSGLKDMLVNVCDLFEAVNTGYEILRQAGGVVLLAPACASFDMFDNFEHRGDVFKREVISLRQRVDKMVKNSGIDRTLLMVALLLIAIGFLMIFSTTPIIAREKFGDSFHFFKKQLLWLTLGLMVFIALILIKAPFYLNQRLIMAIMAMAFTGLSLVFFFQKMNNTSRWIRLAGFSVQPSEFAKIALVLYLAMMLSRKESDVNSIKNLGLLLLPVAFMEGLILKEPDFGNFILIGIITLVMLFLAGVRLKYFVILFAVLIPLFLILIQSDPMRLERIKSFLNPEIYASGQGFQALQSTYAIGSGGLFGQGIGNSTQKLFYLPYAYSDFIYAIIAEELGFFGALAVIALFIIYYLRGMVIAGKSGNPHTYLLVTGLVCLIVLQSMINISVAVGLFPTKGIPLPFISSGGTSLLSSLMITGIILNVSRQRKVVFIND